MYQIFISYSRKSQTIAESISGDLDALGHTIWHDKELSGGQRWWDEILKRVRECDVFVFVLDRHSYNSLACERECAYAHALGKPILPVAVSEIADLDLPEALSVIQFITYDADDRRSALRLARAVGDIQKAPGLPDPLPEPPEAPGHLVRRLSSRVHQSEKLSREEQADLALLLRGVLRDPDHSNQARDLLIHLRRRTNFPRVENDITEFLYDESPTSAQAKLRTTRPDIKRGQSVRRFATAADPKPPRPTRLPPFIGPPSPTPNYLALALLSILCFWPLAIPAIVFALRVNQQTAMGNHAEALASSNKARTFGIIAVVAGAVMCVAYVAFYVASVPLMAR